MPPAQGYSLSESPKWQCGAPLLKDRNKDLLTVRRLVYNLLVTTLIAFANTTGSQLENLPLPPVSTELLLTLLGSLV